jgi:hypothetical protein
VTADDLADVVLQQPSRRVSPLAVESSRGSGRPSPLSLANGTRMTAIPRAPGPSLTNDRSRPAPRKGRRLMSAHDLFADHDPPTVAALYLSGLDHGDRYSHGKLTQAIASSEPSRDPAAAESFRPARSLRRLRAARRRRLHLAHRDPRAAPGERGPGPRGAGPHGRIACRSGEPRTRPRADAGLPHLRGRPAVQAIRRSLPGSPGRAPETLLRVPAPGETRWPFTFCDQDAKVRAVTRRGCRPGISRGVA